MPNQFLSPEGDLENYFVDEYWLIDQYVGDTLWTWGRNYNGQLGINLSGSANNRSTTTQVSGGGTTWKQVAGGYAHTAAVKTDGTLWAWGLNSYGRLGDTTTTQRTIPVVISSPATNWKQVACGDSHTAAVKTDGTLWAWGNNTSGRLGDTTTIQRNSPVVISNSATTWKQVSCGYAHTGAIKIDGTLWTWGQNAYKQLGHSDASGSVATPTQVGTATSWKQIACGSYHTAAIRTDGTLWTCGRNSQGQLGNSTIGGNVLTITQVGTATTWKQVAGGQYHTAAIKTDGTLWTWGRNNEGQIGNNFSGVGVDRATPVQTFLAGTNWKQVSCGLYHTVAVKKDGTVWCWGRNDFGPLGDGSTVQRNIPVQTSSAQTNWKQVVSGGFHTAAVTSGTDPTHFIS
jgi:alpha-tubulin suppressor-like RCC1 family protein